MKSPAGKAHRHISHRQDYQDREYQPQPRDIKTHELKEIAVYELAQDAVGKTENDPKDITGKEKRQDHQQASDHVPSKMSNHILKTRIGN